jgi:hypothetical protein
MNDDPIMSELLQLRATNRNLRNKVNKSSIKFSEVENRFNQVYEAMGRLEYAISQAKFAITGLEPDGIESSNVPQSTPESPDRGDVASGPDLPV